MPPQTAVVVLHEAAQGDRAQGLLKMLEGFGHEWWIQGLSIVYMWGFPKVRVLFLGGPNSKEYSIGESILGSPLFWETTM